MKKRFVLISLLFSLLISCRETTQDNEPERVIGEILRITPSDYQMAKEYVAQIKGCQDIRIVPRTEGYLKEIHIKEGDKVKKGQLLFVIDQTEHLSSVRSARAGVVQAESLLGKVKQEYEGKKTLRDKNVISDFEVTQAKRDVDVAMANLEAAKAQLEVAQNALSFTELRSPSDGIVGRINYRKGDYVGPTTHDGLTIVSDNHLMYVYFSLSEQKVMEYISNYSSIKETIENMPLLSLILPNGKQYAHQGRVESISGVIDESTGSVSVRASFPNKEGLLLSGGTARVILQQNYQGIIVIPQQSTYEILDKIYVDKLIDGKLSSQMISVERVNDGQNYIVTGGLSVGDSIAVHGGRSKE